MGQTSPTTAIVAVVAVLIVVIVVIIFVLYSKKAIASFTKNYKQPIKNGSRLRIRSIATGGYLLRKAGTDCGPEGTIVCNATRRDATLWTAYLCDNCFVAEKRVDGGIRKAPPRELVKGSWIFYETVANTIWAIAVPRSGSAVKAITIDAIPTLESNTVPFTAFFALGNPGADFQGASEAINSGAVIKSPWGILSTAPVKETSGPIDPCAGTTIHSDDSIRSAFVLEPL